MSIEKLKEQIEKYKLKRDEWQKSKKSHCKNDVLINSANKCIDK